ncbi:MAG: glycosyl transferase group 1, partial [Tardiphaga sp.]|nr:glycosyl transferase group 1 [Tardiphaga sp.]
MRVLIAPDAWHPQVNGVVRTLTMMAEAAKGFGVEI